MEQKAVSRVKLFQAYYLNGALEKRSEIFLYLFSQIDFMTSPLSCIWMWSMWRAKFILAARLCFNTAFIMKTEELTFSLFPWISPLTKIRSALWFQYLLVWYCKWMIMTLSWCNSQDYIEKCYNSQFLQEITHFFVVSSFCSIFPVFMMCIFIHFTYFVRWR